MEIATFIRINPCDFLQIILDSFKQVKLCVMHCDIFMSRDSFMFHFGTLPILSVFDDQMSQLQRKRGKYRYILSALGVSVVLLL